MRQCHKFYYQLAKGLNQCCTPPFCCLQQSIPFIDYPTRPLPDKPNTTIFKDVPPNFHTVCDSQGFDETKTGTSGSPLSPTNHVGLNTHYTEYSYTIYTDDDVAKKTGFKDVVLGAFFPSS